MKLYVSLLALCAFQPVAGFVVPTRPAFGTALFSSPPGPPPPGAGGPASQTMTKAGATPTGGAPGAPLAGTSGGITKVKDIWDSKSAVRVQGQSLRTWSFESVSVKSVQVFLKTDGRPLNANVELWQGPDNTYVENKLCMCSSFLLPFHHLIPYLDFLLYTVLREPESTLKTEVSVPSTL